MIKKILFLFFILAVPIHQAQSKTNEQIQDIIMCRYFIIFNLSNTKNLLQEHIRYMENTNWVNQKYINPAINKINKCKKNGNSEASCIKSLPSLEKFAVRSANFYSQLSKKNDPQSIKNKSAMHLQCRM
jgi:hypothetical protein